MHVDYRLQFLSDPVLTFNTSVEVGISRYVLVCLPDSFQWVFVFACTSTPHLDSIVQLPIFRGCTATIWNLMIGALLMQRKPQRSRERHRDEAGEKQSTAAALLVVHHGRPCTVDPAGISRYVWYGI